ACATIAAAQATYQSLGHLPGRFANDYTVPLAVSDDGNVIVGAVQLWDPSYGFYAFRWTDATGMQYLLPDLPAGSQSWPNDISADGTVVVGTIVFPVGDGRGAQAFRWSESDGL